MKTAKTRTDGILLSRFFFQEAPGCLEKRVTEASRDHLAFPASREKQVQTMKDTQARGEEAVAAKAGSDPRGGRSWMPECPGRTGPRLRFSDRQTESRVQGRGRGAHGSL